MVIKVRLPPLPTIKELLRIYKLRATKQLSQNFLLDQNLIRKFVRCAGDLKSHHICEVGPGPGGITRALIESGAERIVLVEKDKRFLPALQLLNEVSNNQIEIFLEDVLHFNMSNLFPEHLKRDWLDGPPNIHVIGNLPFNVSTPLIVMWLSQMSKKTGPWRYGRTKLTLTFQEEVAQRLVAPPLHEQRSRLSIMAQHLCDVEHKFTIPGKAFLPPPDVSVGVVTFTPLKKPVIDLPYALIEKVVRHTFQFRKKMIKHGLRTLFPPERIELTQKLFEITNLEPGLRSQQLTVNDFERICQAYKYICDREPNLFDYYFRDQESIVAWRKVPPLSL